ncbi:VOC family protein [Streptomyces sp. INA 01156]
MAVVLFAGIPVADYAAALAWYERLLGSRRRLSRTTRRPCGAGGTPVCVHRASAEHAGHAMHTVVVDDLDTRVAGIADRGLGPRSRETYSNGVRKVTYQDPDGNEIGFGGAPL